MLLKSYTSVQALRAIAALSVVAFHVSENIERTSGEAVAGGLFRKGFAGVDLFFVVSGFIIVHSSGRYAGRPQALIPYLSKRFFRIFPLYWLSVIPLLLFLGLFPDSRLINRLPERTLSGLLSTLFLLPGHNEVNAVSWTLSFEWYFYLLFGLVIVRREAVWGLSALAIVVLINGLALWYEGIDSGTAAGRFFFLSPLMLEFAVGAGVSALIRRFRVPFPWVWVGAGVLIGWLFCPEKPWDLNRVWSLGPGAGLILLGVTGAEAQNRLRVPGWLVTLGDASYPLYLIHFPLVVLCNKLLILGGATSVSIRCAIDLILVVVLCWISTAIHRYAELPVMQ